MAQNKLNFASEVDPFIGTSTNTLQDNANTLPGAVRPFGMLYWSPDNVAGTFYRREDRTTRGFSLTHLSGPGCSVYGDVPILPMSGVPVLPPPRHPAPYTASYQSDHQVAQPGYYAVQLDSGVGIELAAAVHSGIARVQFPRDQQPHSILVDLSRNLTRVSDAQIQVGGNAIKGSVESDEFCGAENHYRLYFSLEVNVKPESSGTFNELEVKVGPGSRSGQRSGGYLSFAPDVQAVLLKVGLSYVSEANAELNRTREIPDWDFDGLRTQAHEAWNAALGHIQVEGGSKAQRRIFYTALYHSLLHPSVFSDVNSDYIGFDNKVHRTAGKIQYANYSGWDIYRSQVQLLAMLFPQVASDMAESLVLDAEQGGGLPIWGVANDDSCVMVGDPSDLIIASVYAFGAQDFDTKGALNAMVRGASDPQAHSRLCAERQGLTEYLRKGYVARDAQDVDSSGAAAITLEYTSADFAIARFAGSLSNTKEASIFLQRSNQWRNLFNAQTGYIEPRDKEGNYPRDFSPAKLDGFVEGNSAQYTWMVPYDLQGVIQAMGGREVARRRLDDYFSEYGKWNESGRAAGMGYSPHFFISNEPSFGNPWIYNWAGYPWRTQEVVRKTLDDLFTDSSGGLPGNDDLGATSAWAVFAQLGLYPEIPGVGGLTVNSPVFPSATMSLGAHKVHIEAHGAPQNKYIETVAVDGSPVSNWWIDWETFRKADQITFTLRGEPSHTAGGKPPSFPSPQP